MKTASESEREAAALAKIEAMIACHPEGGTIQGHLELSGIHLGKRYDYVVCQVCHRTREIRRTPRFRPNMSIEYIPGADPGCQWCQEDRANGKR